MSLFILGHVNFLVIKCFVALALGCARLCTLSKIFLRNATGMYGLIVSVEILQYIVLSELSILSFFSCRTVLCRTCVSSESLACSSASSAVLIMIDILITSSRDKASVTSLSCPEMQVIFVLCSLTVVAVSVMPFPIFGGMRRSVVCGLSVL